MIQKNVQIFRADDKNMKLVLAKTKIPKHLHHDCINLSQDALTRLEVHKNGTFILIGIYDDKLSKEKISLWISKDELCIFTNSGLSIRKNKKWAESFSKIITDSVKNLNKKLEETELKLVELEKYVFKSNDYKKALEKLYKEKIFWTKVELDVDIQEDVIFDLKKNIDDFDDHEIIQDLHDYFVKTQYRLDRIGHKIGHLQNYVMSVMSNDTNDAMKSLSVIATIMLPITAISSIFGMNFDYIPGAENPYGFIITNVVLFLVLGFSAYWFFLRPRS